MVLVDTSIWIRALSGAEPFRRHLDDLLSGDEVLGHDFVYGELLIGDRGGRTKLLAAYAEMHWARSVSHEEVVSLVRDRKLYGRGMGWIDAHLLSSALVERATFWTADDAVVGVAKALGVTARYPAR
jgi:predicted nucleic acid-binding protein